MYGHQFYLASLSERVEYLNNELKKRKYDSLEVLAEDIFIDIEDLKEELKKGGYFYVPDLNRFVQIEMGQAGSEPSHFLLLRKTCLFDNYQFITEIIRTEIRQSSNIFIELGKETGL